MTKINNQINDILWRGFKDPLPVEEDPDSSQAVFEQKDIAPVYADFDPYCVTFQDFVTEAISAISDELEKNSISSPGITRSYKHITLPEALLYCYIADNPQQKISHARLNKQHSEHAKGMLLLELCIFNQQKQLVSYELNYHYSGLNVIIKQKGMMVGNVTYVLRGQKCEEIEGTLHGKKLILDPVWHPSKKGLLREEHFHYNQQKTTLVYQANKKHSSLRLYGSKRDLSMEHKASKVYKKLRFISKSVQCQTHQFQVGLWFHSKVLIPISGNWAVVT